MKAMKSKIFINNDKNEYILEDKFAKSEIIQTTTCFSIKFLDKYKKKQLNKIRILYSF